MNIKITLIKRKSLAIRKRKINILKGKVKCTFMDPSKLMFHITNTIDSFCSDHKCSDMPCCSIFTENEHIKHLKYCIIHLKLCTWNNDLTTILTQKAVRETRQYAKKLNIHCTQIVAKKSHSLKALPCYNALKRCSSLSFETPLILILQNRHI